jgi:hypothetical protein
MPRWTRRHLLRELLRGIGIAAFAPSAFPSSGFASTGMGAVRSPGAAPLERWLGEWLPDAAAARAIGDVYLAQVPDAARRTRDLGRLLRDQPDADACRALLRERRSRDFGTDAIVLIDGWVLAATEAQLCALARQPGQARRR